MQNTSVGSVPETITTQSVGSSNATTGPELRGSTPIVSTQPRSASQQRDRRTKLYYQRYSFTNANVSDLKFSYRVTICRYPFTRCGLGTLATGSFCAVVNEDYDGAYEVDDIVAHWDTVSSTMEDGADSDLQTLLALADTINRGDVASEAEEKEEVIMRPARRSFPDHDDKQFPQEPLVRKGLRGRKVPLAKLLTNDSENGAHRSAEGTNHNTCRLRLDFTNLEDD
ncbi:unnamed protein product [Phytophthora fragariaefolia]|uniref:Unnamed protein product n=1 Tax=Phytophthora fragariaefolia TaxID=1490495 RepID=A0A9W7CZD4_9STRA|nr:unnamed protein product [Phytophthora fragariaefolia]